MLRVIKKVVKRIYISCLNFGKCGKNVSIGRNCSFAGNKNIFIGNNVIIGRGATFWSTRAKLIIKDNVLFGPNVSIHTGNHEIHNLKKYVIDVTLEEMESGNFGDVIIESDVWIGDGVKILKGVHIKRGCIIGAGAIVTHDTEPYTILGGVPAKKIGVRFTDKEIMLHEEYLKDISGDVKK